MNRRHATIVLVLVFLVGPIAGCRTGPVFDIRDAPISAPNLSSETIKKAIQSAGAALGWQMKEVGQGHIVGTLFLRAHKAQVDIRYRMNSYDITYKDSENLKYDGSSIHKNYNSWVQNLDKHIQTRLSSL